MNVFSYWINKEKIVFLIVFIGAFLLFSIEPIIVSRIIPVYGGSYSVWTTSLVFFTVIPLLGYSYVYFLSRFKTHTQQFSHIVILICTTILQGYFIASGFTSININTGPIISIIVYLTITIGLPFFILTTTFSIVQLWSNPNHSTTTHKLYKISTLGSLLAVASYPFIIQPLFSLKTQLIIWILIYFLYLILSLSYAFFHKKAHQSVFTIKAVISRKNILLYVIFTAVPAMMLIATTNEISQFLPSIPLLWMPPLFLYLTSFVIAFKHQSQKNYIYYSLLVFVTNIWVILIWANIFQVSLFGKTVIYLLAMFFSSIFFHHQLFIRRPLHNNPLGFYFSMILGGAIGTIIMSIFVVFIFKGLWEFPLLYCGSIIGSILLIQSRLELVSIKRLRYGGTILITILLLYIVFYNELDIHKNTILELRNFYGVLSIDDNNLASGKERILWSGNTIHGSQLISAPDMPTTYYNKNTGVGITITSLMGNNPSLHVGIIGLGVGTLAAYCRQTDDFTFYEINPAVISLAKNYFTYVKNCKGNVSIIEGDGRLGLQKEDASRTSAYDLLVIDAFTDDTIPTHLLTKEAFNVYLQRTTHLGIIAIHTSNRYLDLKPVLSGIADQYHLKSEIFTSGNAEWVLLSRTEFLTKIADRASGHLNVKNPNELIWTDSYTNVIPLLK